MLKKIKEYIKNKNYEYRSLMLNIIKNLILTSIVLMIFSIFIKLLLMFKGFIGSGYGSDFISLIPVFLLLISLMSGLYFLITSAEKIDKYCLSFHTDEEIIENIRRYYYSNMNEKTGYIYEAFRIIYKEREDKILEKLKEITPKLPDNWLLNLSGAADVRKILLSKDIIWYSKQVSKKELYNYCNKTIEEIIEKEEKEYYHIILDLFNDFIEEEKILKMKNKLIKENVVSVIHI